jgi:hypothetical protein
VFKDIAQDFGLQRRVDDFYAGQAQLGVLVDSASCKEAWVTVTHVNRLEVDGILTLSNVAISAGFLRVSNLN